MDDFQTNNFNLLSFDLLSRNADNVIHAGQLEKKYRVAIPGAITDAIRYYRLSVTEAVLKI